MKTKYSIDDMRIIAKSRRGKCVSDAYHNKRTKLQWQCSKKHIWEATPDSIIQGSWCPLCAGTISLNINDMKMIAKLRGGKCLSREYVNNKTKLIWKCSNGHKWEATPHNIRRGGWCAKCSGNAPLNIKDMKEIAKLKGGKCLSTSYVNNSTKLLWKCSEKHKWEATPHDIRGGSWCPECYKNNRASGANVMKKVVYKKQKGAIYEIGRVCVRKSGKDAGKICVVIGIIDEITVIIDGFSRKKKSNIKHLEQTEFVVKINEGTTHDEIINILTAEVLPQLTMPLR